MNLLVKCVMTKQIWFVLRHSKIKNDNFYFLYKRTKSFLEVDLSTIYLYISVLTFIFWYNIKIGNTRYSRANALISLKLFILIIDMEKILQGCQ